MAKEIRINYEGKQIPLSKLPKGKSHTSFDIRHNAQQDYSPIGRAELIEGLENGAITQEGLQVRTIDLEFMRKNEGSE